MTGPGDAVDGTGSNGSSGSTGGPESPAELPAVPAGSEVAVRVGIPVSSAGGRTPEGVSLGTRTRRDGRVGRPTRHPQWLVNQLPVGMLQSDFFVRFTSMFQELSGPLMDGADQLEHIPDINVTPVPMLGHLASWIGVQTVDESLPEILQRLILRSSAKALAHRGTIRGLSGYLQMLSGGPAEVTDGGGVWTEGAAPGDVAWVRMRVQGTGHLSEDEFVSLVRDEIPAHVRAELWVADRRVLSTLEEDR